MRERRSLSEEKKVCFFFKYYFIIENKHIINEPNSIYIVCRISVLWVKEELKRGLCEGNWELDAENNSFL